MTQSFDKLLSPWLMLSTNVEFSGMTLDSRQVKPGDVFIAVSGHASDGRRFIDSAIANGAVAVVAEHGQTERLDDQKNIPVIGVEALPEKLSRLAMRAFPKACMPMLIGVTGTNGKTTVTQLCAQLLHQMGLVAGVMGTVGNGLWGQLLPSVNTTSDSVTVAKELAQQAELGAEAVALEVSSHGLSQNRVNDLQFDVAVFTNLSRDHLDYHGDMAAYAAAKKQLFVLPGLKRAVFNLDDAYGRDWQREFSSQLDCLGFSLEPIENQDFYLYVEDVRYHQQGVSARVISNFGNGHLDSPLLGAFNLSNLLAALGALLMQGYSLENLLNQVPKLVGANGRMECFSGELGPVLVVDYAHTPEALSQALTALRSHCDGELWCVFGCGGDRDRGKRPLMAKAAEEAADHLILTADNPRSESFSQIIEDMRIGLSTSAAVIEDREQAIRQAFESANCSDMVLLAGKGHEDYQLIGSMRLEYNERGLAKELTEGAQ